MLILLLFLIFILWVNFSSLKALADISSDTDRIVKKLTSITHQLDRLV